MKREVFENKKGSHVGVVISFVVFVTFILFIQILLQPAISMNKEKKSLLEVVERQILNKTSHSVESVSILVDSSISATCVSFNSFLSDFGFGLNVVVTDGEGDSLDASLASDLDSLQVVRDSVSSRLLKVHYSEGFDALPSESVSCTAVVEGSGYNLGVVTEENYVFEDEISSLIEGYSDYSQLKQDLNIPNSTDLGIGFVFSDGSYINTTEKDVTTNVYVSERQVDYISSEGNILSGKLRLKIW